MDLKKDSKNTKLVLAVVAAILCGGLCAPISYKIVLGKCKNLKQARTTRMEEIERELATNKIRLAEIDAEIDRMLQEHAETGVHMSNIKERFAADQLTMAGANLLCSEGILIVTTQGHLMKEIEELQEQELMGGAFPLWGLRRCISAVLVSAAGGFCSVLFVFWYAGLAIMNRKQKIVLLTGIAIIACMGIYPPWVIKIPAYGPRDTAAKRDAGHSFIFRPPHTAPYSRRANLDVLRLCTQWTIVVFFIGALIAAYANNDDEKSKRWVKIQ
ncbi:MAG: hypothetical protein ACYS32_04890 [Planctomycetota bacterium]|jgi:hypothetical protein